MGRSSGVLKLGAGSTITLKVINSSYYLLIIGTFYILDLKKGKGMLEFR